MKQERGTPSLKYQLKLFALSFLCLSLCSCASSAAEENLSVISSQSQDTINGEPLSDCISDEILMFFEPRSMLIQQHDDFSILQYLNNDKEPVSASDSQIVSIAVPELFDQQGTVDMVNVFFSNTLSMDKLMEKAVNSFVNTEDASIMGDLIGENHISYYSENLDTSVDLYYKHFQRNSIDVFPNMVIFEFRNSIYAFSLTIEENSWDDETALSLAKGLTEAVSCS